MSIEVDAQSCYYFLEHADPWLGHTKFDGSHLKKSENCFDLGMKTKAVMLKFCVNIQYTVFYQWNCPRKKCNTIYEIHVPKGGGLISIVIYCFTY